MKTLVSKIKLAGLMAAAFVVLPQDASAVSVTYGFVPVTDNNAVNTATAGQYLVDVSDEGISATQVKFTFRNTGPARSSIADIYFDDEAPVLLGFSSLINGSGVNFSPGASPSNLPGGNTISFDANFGTDSNAPTQPNGINPGETLTIIFNLLNGNDYADVTAALNAGSAANHGTGLRIGIHVQGFRGGGSESFVTKGNPPTGVPDGGSTAILLGLGALGLGFIRKLRP